MRPPGSGRGMLMLIVGLLLLPFVIGGGLYVSGWHPTRTTNHGQLLNPPQTLPDDLLRSTAEMRGKWIFLLQVQGPCASDCLARLDEMRRIQVALYKNMSRLRRVVLTDQPNDAALAELRVTQSDLLPLSRPAGELSGAPGTLFVVDPQGWLVMRYPPGTSAKDMRADLERLLKFTSNG